MVGAQHCFTTRERTSRACQPHITMISPPLPRRAVSLTLAVFLIMSMFVLVSPHASARTTWIIDSENMTRGTSDGFDQEGTNDGVSNVKTEGGTTRTGTAWLKPDGEGDGVQTWLQGGTSGCIPTTLEWCYLDDNPIHDSNGTYITANPPPITTVISTHDMEQLSVPGVLTSIDSLTFFSWMYGNQTPTNALYAMRLRIVGGNACTATYVTSFFTYTNVTFTWTAGNACGGLAAAELNLANVNSFVLDQSCVDDGVPPDDSNCTVTVSGFVVSYTYVNDFYVDFTTYWDNVQGTDWLLRYDCTTTDAQTTFAVTWASDSVGTVTCDGVERSLFLSSALAPGTAAVQLTSASTTGDTTQSTFSFDLLQLSSDRDITPPNPRDPSNDFIITCDVGFISARCVVAPRVTIIGVNMLYSSWSLSNGFETIGSQVSELSHSAILEYFTLFDSVFVITVDAILDNGVNVTITDDLRVNNSWVTVLAIGGTMLISIVVMAAHGKRSKKGGSPGGPRGGRSGGRGIAAWIDYKRGKRQ